MGVKMSDEFVFAPEEEITPQNDERAFKGHTWKVAIIDDDEMIHKVTKVALTKFNFEGDQIEFIQGYSGQEAKDIFREHDDIAVVLLDVVMENDHSGLDVVKYIREDLKNKNTRIVLRTGQPGQAPEKQVITQYDINDYKEKTELTARKLYTLMYSCLRSYRDIIALEKNRIGLEKVIKSSQKIFSKTSMQDFAQGVMQQITSILHGNDDAFFGCIDGMMTHENRSGVQFIAGTGAFEHCSGKKLEEFLPVSLNELLDTKENSVSSFVSDNYYLAQMGGVENQRSVLFLSGIGPKDETERHMLDLFCHNTLIAFDNLLLRQDIEETQRELVYRLGEAVETRSRETGNHVKRVAEISKLLALKSGLSERQSEILKLASPMHDLGKIGIPDAVLNKPGKLSEDEWCLMRQHAFIGYEMLESSDREILKLGGLISLEHHEKWDGSGYPNAKKAEDISIEGRITAIADVYDALASDRCYKKAWPLDTVYEYFEKESGKHFDPLLVKILIDNIEDINKIRDLYLDEFKG